MNTPCTSRTLRAARYGGLSVLLSLASFVVRAGDLPDPARTPGALNPDVTQATIQQTVCVKGWTKTIRPPAYYTNKLKKKPDRTVWL